MMKKRYTTATFAMVQMNFEDVLTSSPTVSDYDLSLEDKGSFDDLFNIK